MVASPTLMKMHFYFIYKSVYIDLHVHLNSTKGLHHHRI